MAALPVFQWHLAPDGYATRRQLRARGLRPGGQGVAAQLERPRRRRPPLVAYLYRIEDAKPVRPMTAAKWAALAKANAVRPPAQTAGATPVTSSRRRSARACPAPTPTLPKL